jgi:hypothetical protein
MPAVFFLMEIAMLPKMLMTKPDKRCWNYKALFRGDRWIFSWKEFVEVWDVRQNGSDVPPPVPVED